VGGRVGNGMGVGGAIGFGRGVGVGLGVGVGTMRGGGKYPGICGVGVGRGVGIGDDAKELIAKTDARMAMEIFMFFWLLPEIVDLLFIPTHAPKELTYHRTTCDSERIFRTPAHYPYAQKSICYFHQRNKQIYYALKDHHCVPLHNILPIYAREVSFQ